MDQIFENGHGRCRSKTGGGHDLFVSAFNIPGAVNAGYIGPMVFIVFDKIVFRQLHPELLGQFNGRFEADGNENPVGEWNEYEIIVKGGHVVLIVNGEEVNRATEAEVIPGRICLQSEGAEIHFKDIRLIPLEG